MSVIVLLVTGDVVVLDARVAGAVLLETAVVLGVVGLARAVAGGNFGEL